MAVDYLGFLFGAAVAAGGAMGYVKKRSVPSLVAGLAFGSLAAAGAYHVSITSPNLTLSLMILLPCRPLTTRTTR